MPKNSAKPSGSAISSKPSKPSKSEADTSQPFEAAAQIPLAAAAPSKRPKADPDKVTSAVSKTPRRNFRDSLILELKRQEAEAEADRKTAEAVEHSKTLH